MSLSFTSNVWGTWTGELCDLFNIGFVGMKASYRDFKSDPSQPMITALLTLRHAVETVAVSSAECESFFRNERNCYTFTFPTEN